MALDSPGKRGAAAGAGRPYMRSSFPASLSASQRSSIGLSYPVADFPSVLLAFPKIASWLEAKTQFSGTINDKMRLFLNSKGYVDGTINDDFYTYLEDNGYALGKSTNDKVKAATATGWLWQQ